VFPSLATCKDLFTQQVRDLRPLECVRGQLRHPLVRSRRTGRMAGGPGFAHRLRDPPAVVRPNVGGLHYTRPILAVGDRAANRLTGSAKCGHLPHVPHHTARVFDEPTIRLIVADDIQRLVQQLDSQHVGVLRHFHSGRRVCNPVFPDRADTKLRAWWTGPDYIRPEGDHRILEVQDVYDIVDTRVWYVIYAVDIHAE
jgi:hypothetical protein